MSTRRAFLLALIVSVATATIVVHIKISPSTLVKGGPGEWVTVNTDVPYTAVDRTSLTLSGVPVAWTKADAKGQLVAKFRQADVDPIVAPPSATLVLAGRLRDGTSFSAADTIAVIAK